MATGVICAPPILQFTLNNGQLAAGGSILTQVGGVNAVTYQDIGVATPLPNPIPLNSRGEISNAVGASCQLFLTPNTVYTFTLFDGPNGTGNQIWVATYVNGIQVTLTQAAIGLLLYPQTAAEAAAGVTPTNFAYPPGDMRRYGVDLTGVADSTTAMQNCISCSAGAGVYLPNGTYKFTSLNGIANLRLSGQSRNGVILNSSTSGTAIQCATFSNLWFEHFTLNTTNSAATAMEFGTGVQHVGLSDMSISGSSGATAGVGIFLNSGNPGAFSGNFLAQLVEVLGYKVAVAAAGHDLGLNTWTSMSFLQCFLSGNTAKPAGSIGLWFDHFTNGVGSNFYGGSIEGFATGMQIDNGGSGLDYNADNEGNTATFTVGATFTGQIKLTNTTGNDLQASCNGAANRWWQRRQLNGVVTEENFFNRQFLLYDDNGGQSTFGIYRGPQTSSFISGTANPTFAGGFVLAAGSVVSGSDNYFVLSGHTIHWDSQSPQVTARGTWAVGDVCYNNAVAIGQPKGWRCTAAGAPGTWVSEGNL